MQKITTLLLLLVTIFATNFCYAQHTNYHLGTQTERRVSKKISTSEEIIHTGFKPLMKSYIERKTKEEVKTEKKYNKKVLDWTYRKMFVEDFFIADKKDIEIRFNVLMNIHQGRNSEKSESYSQNTRAFEVYGDLGNNLSFYSSFYENQAFFPKYLDEKIENSFVVPGQGSWKDFERGDQMGRDFGYASGYISYSFFKFFNFQFGHGKHFVGNGYRSLLLSDNSFNYPFAKTTFYLKNFQYTTLLTEFQAFDTRYYMHHDKKHGSFNFLSYSPIQKIEISLFQGIIWDTSDDSTYTKKFPSGFFVPLGFFRPLQYGLDGKQNILLGTNLKIKPIKYTEVYGQFALDNLNFSKLGTDGYFENRYGYQAGAKIYDVLFGKVKNVSLYMQAEYNYASPYMYQSQTRRQEYSHYNQPLSHPLGGGFSETVLIANAEIYGLFFEAKLTNAKTSTDTLGTNFGSNIFNINAAYGEANNSVGQGVKTTITNSFYTVGYIFNKTTNLQFFATVQFRKYENMFQKTNEQFLFFGVRTNIDNFYYDF